MLFDTHHMFMGNDAEVLEKHGINRVLIRSVLTCEAAQGVCARCYGINLAVGSPVNPGEAVGVIAAQYALSQSTQLTMRTFHTGGIAGDDITQGLPRVEELFEARRPKRMATLSEISGTVSIEETRKNAMFAITVTNEAEGATVVYTVPYSSGILVQNGDHVDKGQELTSGALNPHDVLRIRGVDDDEFGRPGVRNYLVQEVQKVYRQQGVDINDKHIEVIVRQMLRKVRVEDAGDTTLLSGATVDVTDLRRENKLIAERSAAGERREDGSELLPATYTQILMGITKASLATESFLSAASFQETTKVLTDAAIKGKVDHLVGLKENVIIGKLIPRGQRPDHVPRLRDGDRRRRREQGRLCRPLRPCQPLQRTVKRFIEEGSAFLDVFIGTRPAKPCALRERLLAFEAGGYKEARGHAQRCTAVLRDFVRN